MKDMQAQAKKIRSDAAECLVLSNLVNEERRHLFGRIAEHLNSLAAEIEAEAATTVNSNHSAVPDERIVVADQPAAPSDQARRSWRPLRGSLLFVFIVIAGAAVWGVNRTGFNLSNLLPKTAAESQASVRELATLLSEERREREASSDQLSALLARLDTLARDLDDLKSLHAGIAAPSAQGDSGQKGPPPGTEAKPPPADETRPPAETSSTSSVLPAAVTQTTGAAPAAASPASTSSDQVGTIPTVRTDLDPNKFTVGPAGCTHFRSFDPISGTYMTFDGRRRQCR